MDASKDDITIDESVRFKGTVQKFDRRRGFGKLIPEGKGDDDAIFAHWRQIESSDEWPALKEGMVVEYYVGTKADAKRKSQKQFAAKITLEGGNPVTCSEERTYPNRARRSRVRSSSSTRARASASSSLPRTSRSTGPTLRPRRGTS